MTDKILQILKSENLVDETNDQIIYFGLCRIWNGSIDFLFTVACAALLGDIAVGIIFELCYGSLRVFAGGYHALNKRNCTYLTYASIILSLLIVFKLNIYTYIMHMMLLTEMIFIIFKVPVETKNRPLNQTERKVYHRYCIYICLAELIFYIVFILGNAILFAKTIFIAVSFVIFGILPELRKSNLFVVNRRKRGIDQ